MLHLLNNVVCVVTHAKTNNTWTTTLGQLIRLAKHFGVFVALLLGGEVQLTDIRKPVVHFRRINLIILTTKLHQHNQA